MAALLAVVVVVAVRDEYSAFFMVRQIKLFLMHNVSAWLCMCPLVLNLLAARWRCQTNVLFYILSSGDPMTRVVGWGYKGFTILFAYIQPGVVN